MLRDNFREKSGKICQAGHEEKGFLVAVGLPDEEVSDKGTPVPFQFPKAFPLLEIPIDEQSAVLMIQRRNDGRDEVPGEKMEDDAGLLNRQDQGFNCVDHRLPPRLRK